MRINDVDNDRQCISRSTWRGVCMGFREDGGSMGSNSDWASWASIAGVVDANGNPSRRRSISKREAFLLLVIGKLPQICYQLGIENPKPGRPDPKRKKNPPVFDYFSLESIANQWLDHLGQSNAEAAIRSLTQDASDIPGSKLKEVLETWLGKSVSLKTIRRRSRGTKISTKKLYSGIQIRRILRSLI